MIPNMDEENFPPRATPPTCPPEEAITHLQELIGRGFELEVTGPSNAQMSAYRMALKSILLDAFGSESDWYPVISAAGQFLGGFEDDENQIPLRCREIYEKNLLLAEAVNELKRKAARSRSAVAKVPAPNLATLENILHRFHKVATQLRTRHKGRNTLEINDEYDVQDLLHALLLVSFTDVRLEEYGPSVAGARPRMDFLLKEEQIVIEVKKTREKLTTRALGDELIADIARYQAHPDCKTLVCFIYDPGGQVSNVAGFTNDIERTPSKMPVRVLVVPQH
jgi:hypothetical protein